jgi:hypothetical protein
VIVLIIAGVILIGVFIFWQSIYKFPLMPLYIWRDRNFSLVPPLLPSHIRLIKELLTGSTGNNPTRNR